MSTIDNRIVEMSFDNKKFEKGIAKSQKSLKDFNKALEFDGATKGVDTFTASFSKMGMVANSVIQNLTNRIVNFGIKAAKSLTVAPVMDGYDDFTTKLTTMQTITNATGKFIAEVEGYFKELDIYADKTIYNLTDMTSSLAKFTNANVDLEKSIPAIKGIANMTALAGQDANAASIAMYNFSQSIAGGFLNSMDYKSLNLANVATFEWKNHMIEAAVAAGTLKKATNGYTTAAGKAYSGSQLFTEGLKDQWATTEVMLKVLGDYGDETTDIGKKAQAAAQDVKSFGMMVETLKAAIGTGWTDSFEQIIGNLDESKQLWTSITNAASAFIDTITDGRNAMLEFWHDNGGRDAFLQGLKNIGIALVTVLLTVSRAVDQIFPPKTQQQFVNMFKTFELITGKMVLSETTANKLQRTFAGLFSVISVGIEAVKFFGSVLGQIIGAIFPGFSGGLLEITANIGDVLVVLRSLIIDTGFFQKALGYTSVFVDLFVNGIKNAFITIVGFIGGLVKGEITLSDIGAVLLEVVTTIKDFISLLFQGHDVVSAFNMAIEGSSIGLGEFSGGFSNAFTMVQKFLGIVGEKLGPAFDWISEKLSNIGIREIAIIAVGVGLIAISKTLLKGLTILAKAIGSIVNPFRDLITGFSGILTAARKAITAFTNGIKANTLFTIAKSIALLALSLAGLAFIPIDKLAVGLGALTILMIELVAVLLLLNTIKVPVQLKGHLIALSAGLFILAKTATMYNAVDWGGMLKAGAAMGSFLGMLVLFSTKVNAINLAVVGKNIISFSGAMIVFSGALHIMSSIPAMDLIQGTLAIAYLFTAIGIYTKLMDGSDFAIISTGMISFALGITILAGALKFLGDLPFADLLQGSVTLTALLSVLSLYVKLMGGRSIAKASTGMISLGVGIIAIAGALTILSNLSFGKIIQGSAALLALMTVLGLFMKLTNGTEMYMTGSALIGLGVGLIAMTGALALLGALDMGQLIQGGAAIAVLLGTLAAFIKITNGTDLGVTSLSMIALSTGIGLLAGVLTLLTLIDTPSLIATTAAIGGLIIALGVFSRVTDLSGLSQSALGIGLFALALLGMAIPIKMIAEIPWQQLLATAGIIVSSIAMFAVVAATMKLFAAVVPSIIPAMIGVVGVSGVIVVIGAMLAAIGGLSRIPGVENIIADGGKLLETIGQALGGFVGGLIGGIGIGVTAALPKMAENMVDFADAMEPFFNKIKGIDASGISAVKHLAETMLILGGAKLVDTVTSWVGGKGASLKTFADELVEFAPGFISFAKTMEYAKIKGGVVESTATAIKTMAVAAKGLPNQGNSVAKWLLGDNTLSVFASELKDFAPDFVSFAKTMEAGEIKQEVIESTAVAIETMSKVAKGLPNQGNSVSKWLLGDNTLSVFAEELATFAPDFVSFAKTMEAGEINNKVIKSTANAVKTMSKVAKGLPNQGNSVDKWLRGDNTLSVFAEELATFAPKFVEFANTMQDGKVDNDVVNNTAIAVRVMSEVMEGLPSQRGGIAKWFKGDNSLSNFAEELVKFAPKFVEFAEEFAKVDSTTVQPSLDALVLMVDTLNINGGDAMKSLAKGFENNKSSTISTISTVLSDVTKTVNDKSAMLVPIGENIIMGLIKGMTNKKQALIKTTKDVVVDAVDGTARKEFEIHSPSKNWWEMGVDLLRGLIGGIKEKKDGLVETVKGLTSDLTGGLATGLDSDGMASSFTLGLEGLLADMTATFDAAGFDAGTAFGNGFDASNFMGSLGKTKTTKGNKKKEKTEFEKFKDRIDELKFYRKIDTAEELKEWETFLKENLKIYKKGSDERKEIDRTIYTLKNDLITETYQNEINSIERKNYFGRLSLEAELKRYRELRREYKKGSDEYEEIKRKIFELEKKIYETQKQYINDVKDAQSKADAERVKAREEYDEAVSKATDKASKDGIKAQKKYDETIQKAEQDAYKKRQDAYDKYNDAVSKATKKNSEDHIKLEEDLAKDLLDIQEKLHADVLNADQKYQDALKARADTIYGYYGIFDEIGERAITTPEEILKNISDQNAAIEDWRHSLQQLEERGVSDILLKELQDLGVSSSGQLSAMLAMTDEQLQEFITLFDRKHELADTQALKELIDYREEINSEIEDLYKQADTDMIERVNKYNQAFDELNASLRSELDEASKVLNDSLDSINKDLDEKTLEAKTTFNDTMREINITLQEELDSAKKIFNKTTADINNNLKDELQKLKDTFTTTMETVHDKTTTEYRELNKDLKKELKTLNKEVDKQMKELSTTTEDETKAASESLANNTESGSRKSKESLQDLNDSTSTIFSNFNQSLYMVGMSGAQGLASGLMSGEYAVRAAGSYIASAAVHAAKTALNIHSPSREMEELGVFADLGLINGLMKLVGKVKDAAVNVGKTAIEGLIHSLSGINNLNLDLLDITPTITPILDLSNIESGYGLLNDMLSSDQAYRIADQALVRSQKGPLNQNGSISSADSKIENIFNIKELVVRNDNDVDLIARQLYRKQEVASRGRGFRQPLLN